MASDPLSNQPPVEPPDLGNQPPAASTVQLNREQILASGLDGLNPGDEFTVTISGIVQSSDDGLTGEITSAEMGMKPEPMEDIGADAEFAPPQSKIELGPPEGMRM